MKSKTEEMREIFHKLSFDNKKIMLLVAKGIDIALEDAKKTGNNTTVK